MIFPNGSLTIFSTPTLQIGILSSSTFSLTFLLASLAKSYLMFLDTCGLRKKRHFSSICTAKALARSLMRL